MRRCVAKMSSASEPARAVLGNARVCPDVEIDRARGAGVSHMNASSCLCFVFKLFNRRSASSDARSAAREPREVLRLQTVCDAVGNSASSCREYNRLRTQPVSVSQSNREDDEPRFILFSFERMRDRTRSPTSTGRLSPAGPAFARGGFLPANDAGFQVLDARSPKSRI